jgi:hypothetical protein
MWVGGRGKGKGEMEGGGGGVGGYILYPKYVALPCP